jgi:DNA-binding transcriptional ArsR family regulator
VTDLAAPFRLSLNAVSRHLQVLEAAALVRRRREGREHWLVLRPAPLRDAANWIARYGPLWSEEIFKE